jgi:hypothetical protein
MGFHPEIVEVWHTFDPDGRYQLPDSRFQMWDSVSVTSRISRCGRGVAHLRSVGQLLLDYYPGGPRLEYPGNRRILQSNRVLLGE